jgi:hypothetical protein
VGRRESLQEHGDRLISNVPQHPTEMTEVVELPRPYFKRCAADDAGTALQLYWQEADAITGTKMASTAIARLIWN